MTISNKPHLAHLQNTMIKKNLAEKAKESSYSTYKRHADAAKAAGWEDRRIIEELEAEIKRIEEDERNGDPLFKAGVKNAKVSCISSIRVLISELKGESNVIRSES